MFTPFASAPVMILLAALSLCSDASALSLPAGTSLGAAPDSRKTDDACAYTPTWRFSLNFESIDRILPFYPDVPEAYYAATDIENGTVKSRSKDLLDLQPVCKLRLQYQGGTEAERFARITSDPVNQGNRALHFWLQTANVRNADGIPIKGRIQTNINAPCGIRTLHQKVRLFLHEDFNFVRSYPYRITWLTIAEFWNNAAWTGEAYPFRISVNIVKVKEKNAPLRLGAKAQSYDTKRSRWNKELWSFVNRNFELPIGKWVTIEYQFVEGNAATGRLQLFVTPDGSSRAVVFNITNFTHHPNDPAPDGLLHYNPLKLYTSLSLIDHVRENNGAIQLYWDNLDVSTSATH